MHAPISLDRFPTRATDMTPTDVPETCHRIPSPVPALRSVLRRRQPAGATGAPAVLYVHGATFPSALSVRYRFVTETDDRSWADALCARSEEHTSELQSLMRISYAVFCLKKKKNTQMQTTNSHNSTKS